MSRYGSHHFYHRHTYWVEFWKDKVLSVEFIRDLSPCFVSAGIHTSSDGGLIWLNVYKFGIDLTLQLTEWE
jgi:hypothetical protein